MLRTPTPRLLVTTLLALSALGPTGLAQGGQDAFYRAYFLQHEGREQAGGGLEAAAQLYREALADRALPAGLRERARRALREVQEDLATADFARLCPADTLFYVEVNHPGEELGHLLNQLGLLRADGGSDLGVSPRLLEGALGLRGAALAITQLDPEGGPPEGVLLLHPGDREVFRGLLETGLAGGGQPTEALGGHPTWILEEGAHATLTSRLCILGSGPDLIEDVLGRLEGGGGSLAETAGMQRVSELRQNDLLFFHANAEPVLPLLRYALEQEARRDPDAAMAMNFIDVDSLRSLSGRLALGPDGVALDLALDLADGHRNLLFNLLRTPPVGESTLALVPGGAAFFAATSLNEAAPVTPVGGTRERPIVTAMDFGREIFANLVDVVVYGLPPSPEGPPLPDVVVALRVNDASRSKALWNFVLGLASQKAGAPDMEPEEVLIAGLPAERYLLEGLPVYLVTREHEMLVSPSRSALERSLAARAEGRTASRDALLARGMSALPSDATLALVIAPGRCAQMALPFAATHETGELELAADLLRETVFGLGLQQSDTRLGLTARLLGLPDVEPLLARELRRNRRAPRERALAVAPLSSAPQPASIQPPSTQPASIQPARDEAHAASLAELRARFDDLAAEASRRPAAEATARALIDQMGSAPLELNDFAWSLLTESRYGERFDELARLAARRANELTDHGNWALLDTLALAEFKAGEVDRAIELERRALELVRGTGREAEVREMLERFLEADEAEGTNRAG